VSFRLIYHPAVASHDLLRLDAQVRLRVMVALEERVAAQPTMQGKPLRGTLKGLWSMRVGDHRIIYTVAENEVWVLKIGHRREAYRDAVRRLRS
jgi:mRNA interferase RelE/StbE